MSREIRRVPAEWEHPTGIHPWGRNYLPMHDKSYREVLENWWKDYQTFESGTAAENWWGEERREIYAAKFRPGAGLIPVKILTYKRALEAWFQLFLQSERQGEFWNEIGVPPQPHEFDFDGESAENDGSFELWNWNGGPPDDPLYYRPDWPVEAMTHYQMYETVSEGTPVSPVFSTKDKLENWLVNTKGYSRSNARSFVENEWAPTMAFMTNSEGQRTSEIRMGVDALGILANRKEPDVEDDEFREHADYDWDAAHDQEDRAQGYNPLLEGLSLDEEISRMKDHLERVLNEKSADSEASAKIYQECLTRLLEYKVNFTSTNNF